MREYQVISQYLWKGVSAIVTYKVICKPRYIDCLFIYVYCGAHSHLTVCDPMDYSPQGSSVHGIFQEKILERIAIAYSKGSSWPGIKSVSLVCGFFTTVPPRKPLIPVYMYIYNVYYKILYVYKDKYNVTLAYEELSIDSSASFCVCVCVLVAQSCLTFCNPIRLLCLWDSPGKTTGVGFHSLFQGIFLTQGLNLGPLHCRQVLYHLSHQGSTQHHLCPTQIHWQSK